MGAMGMTVLHDSERLMKFLFFLSFLVFPLLHFITHEDTPHLILELEMFEIRTWCNYLLDSFLSFVLSSARCSHPVPTQRHSCIHNGHRDHSESITDEFTTINLTIQRLTTFSLSEKKKPNPLPICPAIALRFYGTNTLIHLGCFKSGLRRLLIRSNPWLQCGVNRII